MDGWSNAETNKGANDGLNRSRVDDNQDAGCKMIWCVSLVFDGIIISLTTNNYTKLFVL